MIIIDAKGLACPIPVIEAKKAIERLPAGGGIIQVLVDNSAACENLKKMSAQKGYVFSVEKRADKIYAITLTVGEGHAALMHENPTQSGLAVAIGQDKMGAGNDDLGKILIKGFIYSLANLSVSPKAVIFFNSGVMLTADGANTVEDLKELKKKGTEILVCGTCADFYKIKQQIAVGEIVNMYKIVETLALSGSVINV